ncbi:MAG: DUF2779 domain-containing protein [Rhodobacteraceae bacterium]|nr:DUF2779 domain-containing protein [Paracoccaceae bacterium]MCY4140534.1 DUF2779 domain-containing protein [Paracoccaceae bacterium]
MRLTKSDFIQYLHCPKSLWLLKREPENYPDSGSSAFDVKLARGGYDVERHVRQLFQNEGRNVVFQEKLETDDGLLARVDAVEQMVDGKIVLHEIKSSTRVKDDHVADACFQKVCAERAGQKIDRVSLVHLNGAYVRQGEIDPREMLVFADITDKVEDIEPEIIDGIDEALEFLAGEIDRNGCSCPEESRQNHCDTFELFNPGVPSPSVYSLPRLSKKKRKKLVSKGIFGLEDIPKGFSLTAPQSLVVRSAMSGKPRVKARKIRRFLSKLVFPLHFFDYETFASAVPLVDGTGPHRHFPVQYSLHILEKNGTLTHREYLEREARLPLRLVEQLQADIGRRGSIISWHASFERARNRDMAAIYPDKEEFLYELNDRTVDLEEVFKKDYVDARFDGSTSIKNVLPVLCPELDYSDLVVQDGSSAMAEWERMIQAGPEEADKIAQALLLYCERDTRALVAIHAFLRDLVES